MAEGKTITIIQKGKQVQHYIIINLRCNGCSYGDSNGYTKFVLTQGSKTLVDELVGDRWFKNSTQYRFRIDNKTDPIKMTAEEILWFPADCPQTSTEGGLWWNGQCYGSFNSFGNTLNHTFQPNEFTNNDLYVNMEIRDRCY